MNGPTHHPTLQPTPSCSRPAHHPFGRVSAPSTGSCLTCRAGSTYPGKSKSPVLLRHPLVFWLHGQFVLGGTVVQASDGQGDGIQVDTLDGAPRREVPLWPGRFSGSRLRWRSEYVVSLGQRAARGKPGKGAPLGACASPGLAQGRWRAGGSSDHEVSTAFGIKRQDTDYRLHQGYLH